MRIDNLKWLMILGSLLGVVGLVLIYFCKDIGASLADGWLAQYDYSPSDYESKVKTNTTVFLVIGSVLLGIGFSTVFFTLYKMLNIKD
ncbi:hypothetical protein [Ornithinibacillus californiensis]|uniref:hypothetical protein n=1 Tax=Ornithinibacillus californiensis TaxID=161536 RepID=UPI00064DA626|nr:hypothetical protein [Ornithinibacillus californiensis]